MMTTTTITKMRIWGWMELLGELSRWVMLALTIRAVGTATRGPNAARNGTLLSWLAPSAILGLSLVLLVIAEILRGARFDGAFTVLFIFQSLTLLAMAGLFALTALTCKMTAEAID